MFGTCTSTHSPCRGDLFNTSLALASPGGMEAMVSLENACPMKHSSNAKLRREIFMSGSFPWLAHQSRKKQPESGRRNDRNSLEGRVGLAGITGDARFRRHQ